MNYLLQEHQSGYWYRLQTVSFPGLFPRLHPYFLKYRYIVIIHRKFIHTFCKEHPL